MSWKIRALIVMLASAPAAVAGAGQLATPAVPPALEVPAGLNAFMVAHAAGTQNYVCMPSGKKAAWAFHGPQATLFDAAGEQVVTHYLSPNPDEQGALRATWRDSRDTSTIWAVAVASYSGSDYVAPGSIPWLLLRVTGSEYGPTGGDTLTASMFIQRVNTSGGVAPRTGCQDVEDIGRRAMVPYTTDYVFYR